MSQPKKKLDTVVKLGLGVFFGAFLLIFGGMFLTRPDRSIPPYSIGAQDGTAVAVHVPGNTSDSAIETLIRRFRKVGRETRDFGPMKIRPTTPGDPEGRYARITIYVFTHEAWTEPEILTKYLSGEDRELRQQFEKAVRGLYRLGGGLEEGRIGPILAGKESPATAAYARELFRGAVTVPAGGAGPGGAASPAPTPSPTSTAPATRDR